MHAHNIRASRNTYGDRRRCAFVGHLCGDDAIRAVGRYEATAPGEAEIAFLLTDDTVDSLRVVFRDPTTDAELYRSPTDIAVKLGVG